MTHSLCYNVFGSTRNSREYVHPLGLVHSPFGRPLFAADAITLRFIRTFIARYSVYLDDLDAFGMLHNGRYTALVGRGIPERLTKMGLPIGHEGTTLVVREIHLTFDIPIQTVGEIGFGIWVSRICSSSLRFGFTDTRADCEHVRETRSVTEIDPAANRSAPWSHKSRALLGIETIQASAFSSRYAQDIS